MVQSKAPTVVEYLAELPPERRKVIAAARAVIRKHLPKGYVEAMNWGMICYEIPLKVYPNTYNKQPLACVALAAQKNNYALYMMAVYGDKTFEPRLLEGFAAINKKPNRGKSCIRFKAFDDLPWDVIGELIAEVPPARYIQAYEHARADAAAGKAKC
ncbi:MAG: DUF1801 domain-containing protein [Pirellulales bacterium]